MQENRLCQHQFIPMECQEFVYRGQSSFTLHAVILVRKKWSNKCRIVNAQRLFMGIIRTSESL